MLTCAWDYNKSHLATAGMDKLVYTFSTPIGVESGLKNVARLSGHASQVTGCQFSSDGSFLVTSSWDTRVIVWDCLSWERKKTLCHVFPVPQFHFRTQIVCLDLERNNNRLLATISDDDDSMLLRLWDLWKTTTGNLDARPLVAIELDHSEEGGCQCVFSPSGSVLAVASHKRINFYRLPADQFPTLQNLCRMSAWKYMSQETLKAQIKLLPHRLSAMMRYQWEEEEKEEI